MAGNKTIRDIAIYASLGVICLLLLWRPWQPSEASLGFKSADEEMRELLTRQSESGDNAAKQQAAPKGSASQPRTEPKESTAKPETATKESTAEPETRPQEGAAMPATELKEGVSQQPPTEPKENTTNDMASQPGEHKSAVSGEPPAAAETKQEAGSKAKINLNRATAAQLDALPGIGASRAQAILTLRQKLGGRFESVEQLLEVKGIGEKMLEKIAPLVTLEP